MRTSGRLIPGEIYNRKQLAKMFEIPEDDPELLGTYGVGVYRPTGSSSVWLLITEKKGKDRPDYHDKLDGDKLIMDGQKSKDTDEMITQHSAEGLELLLFYRRYKGQYPRSGYKYEGEFLFRQKRDTPTGQPTSFTLHRKSAQVASQIENQLDTMNTELLQSGYFNEKDERRRTLREIAARRGSKQFRDKLLEAYSYRCAITACDVVSALEAAHVTPYRNDDSNEISNGLLLRADVHTLFDLGLITVDPLTMKVKIANVLVGSSYEHLNGTALRLPDHARHRPSPERLAKHNTDVFQSSC